MSIEPDQQSNKPERIESKPERLRKVADRLLSGVPVSRVAKEVSQEFKCSERAVWRDIKEVRQRWVKQDEELMPSQRAHMMRVLEEITHKALIDREYNAAVQAIKQYCKITGLEVTTQNIQIGAADEGMQKLIEGLKLTPRQRQQRMLALEEKATEG